ncbi:hypothetical protein [Nonomuraea recticatena]|uniref:Transposase n=1 Tax=Nonomuraea recticatena TaxID=46178 RepID=A0ABN3T7K2_9ACTN
MLEGIVIDATGVLNDKLHRPHRALGGQAPYERLERKTQVLV